MTLLPRRFKNLSIRSKLITIIVSSSLLVTLLTTIFFIGVEIYSFRRDMVQNLTGLARVISVNSIAPLEFIDPEAVNEVLASLSARPHITQAAIYDVQGNIFGSYTNSPDRSILTRHLDSFNKNILFNPKHIDLYLPINDNGKIVGVIFLRADLGEFYAKLRQYGLLAGLILLGAFFFAWFISYRLQQIISQPVISLAEAMTTVRERGDYSVRAAKIYNDELGVLVDGFNSMLDHIQRYDQQLIVAKEEAEQASLAKSEFLAHMSHEIRTPMNGVLGIASLLQNTSLNSKQQQFVETIIQSGRSLLTIINDILDFSKIEAGKLELEQIDFNLRDLVEETVEILSGQVHQKGLNIAVDLDFAVPYMVAGDPDRLRQILLNLLGNAIKFTKEGEIIVQVKVEDPEQPWHLHITVKDTGIGIPAAKLNQIFSAFIQADGSTSRQFGGTGLGLSISRQLVKMMQGSIGVDSIESRGSAFWFTIKLQPAKIMETVKNRDLRPLKGLRVLIVMGYETARKILHEQIISWGMHNGNTDNALQALEMLEAAVEQNRAYDIVIIDEQIQGMEAPELVRSIRNNARICSLGLIMAYAPHTRNDEAILQTIGINCHLTQPIRQSRLFDCLINVINESCQVTPEPQSESQPEQFPVRVLVAEDNPANQLVAAGMLEKMGCNVDLVDDGLQAVAAVRKHTYDLVFMDCQMPLMDGYRATEEIREYEQKLEKRPLPIIALTAHALQGDREKCLRVGMNDYLSKPFEERQLRQVVNLWLPQHHNQIESPKVSNDNQEHRSGTSRINQAALDVIKQLQRPGQPDFLNQIITTFLTGSPPHLEKLKQAAAKGDHQTIWQIAHTLKSSSATLGAMKLAEICHELEKTNRKLEPEQADQEAAPEKNQRQLKELEREFSLVEQELLRIRKEHAFK